MKRWTMVQPTQIGFENTRTPILPRVLCEKPEPSMRPGENLTASEWKSSGYLDC